MEALAVLLIGAWVLFPFVLAFWLRHEARRRRALEDTVGALERRVGELYREVRGARTARAASTPTATATATATSISTSTPTATATATATSTATSTSTATATATPTSTPTPTPTTTTTTTTTGIATATPTATPTVLAGTPLPPPLPPREASPPDVPAPAAGPPPGDAPWRLDWERVVGVKLYSWLAGVAVAVAAISFVRYSVEHGLLSPPVRLAMGLAAGVGLLAGAEARVARRYALTAQALAGGGVVTLFATFWAAHALWALVPAVAAFALLALVAAVAVLFAVRRDAFPVALLGLAGGFATPVLLSTGQDRPFGLFSYLLLLDVGLLWVARRRRWPLLAALAAGLTALYQAGWVIEFVHDPAKLPVAIGVFLVFCALGFVALALSLRGGAPVPALARWTAALGALPPVLFAIHVASRPELASRWPLLLGFVAVIAVGLAVVAAWQGPEWLHLVGAGAPIVVLAALTLGGDAPAGTAPGPRLWPGVGAFVLLLGAIPLAAPALAARLGRPLRAEGRWAIHGAPLLLLVLARLGAPDGAARAAPWSFTAVALLLLAGCAAAAVRAGDAALQALAVVLAGVALATHAIPAGAADWQDPPGAARALAALLGAVALGLVALGAPLLAERAGRRLRFRGDELPAEAFVLCAHLLVLLVAVDRSRPLAPAALLVALAVLHLAVVADALRRRSVLLPVSSAAAAVLAVYVGASRGELGAVAGGAALAVAVGSVLAVAWRLRSEAGALGAAGIAAAAIAAAHAAHATGAADGWSRGAALSAEALPWLLPVAYPLLRGAAARGERLSWGGAVLASAAFFPAARSALVALGAAPYIGALPVVQALILVPHVAALVRGGPAATPVPRGILALVAGAALAFVTVAIPLQLEKQWITLGWALEAAALAGLWRRVPHRGLLAACAGLLAAVLVRLVVNPALLRYHARSHTPIWNWFLYAYLTAAAAAFATAWLLARPRAAAAGAALDADRALPGWPRVSALAAAQGGVLLFALVNLEIADYFSTGRHLVFRIGASVQQDLTYTIAWAVFALGLLAAGVRLASRPARFAAIGLLSLTVLKAFLHDLSNLEGLYRVASFVGLAASLAAVAVVLQRFVLRPGDGRAPKAAP